jgi:hypothetical protein
MTGKIKQWVFDRAPIIYILILLVIGGCLLGIVGGTLRNCDCKKQSESVTDYSHNCALNKGIAVRDLEGKMRCVPTFSAK